MKPAALALLLLALPQSSIEMEATYEYLLSPAERSAYDALATRQERVRFLEEFWADLDPTPETGYNELRELYLGRLELADLYFSLPFREGWRTDRGRVLVFFGSPAEIRRSPFGPAAGPKHEIWVYRFEGGADVELVFEDRADLGEFVLLSPVIFPERLPQEREVPRLAEDEGEGGAEGAPR